MRIAYIILCHTDPEHIRRLTKKITGGTDDEAFIHVDGKCDGSAAQSRPFMGRTAV